MQLKCNTLIKKGQEKTKTQIDSDYDTVYNPTKIYQKFMNVVEAGSFTFVQFETLNYIKHLQFYNLYNVLNRRFLPLQAA